MTDAGTELCTRGVVMLPEGAAYDEWRNRSWHDLSPFAQGYVEALFADADFDPPMLGETADRVWGFSDLAPETLALILRDCGEGESYHTTIRGRWYNPNSAGGSCFWQDRQAGLLGREFPPLEPYLGDDGKVYLREVSK